MKYHTEYVNSALAHRIISIDYPCTDEHCSQVHVNIDDNELRLAVAALEERNS